MMSLRELAGFWLRPYHELHVPTVADVRPETPAGPSAEAGPSPSGRTSGAAGVPVTGNALLHARGMGRPPAAHLAAPLASRISAGITWN